MVTVKQKQSERQVNGSVFMLIESECSGVAIEVFDALTPKDGFRRKSIHSEVSEDGGSLTCFTVDEQIWRAACPQE